MGTAAHYIRVNAPAQACYDWWRPLTALPEIFADVQRVDALSDGDIHTRWSVRGPGGVPVTWDAEIVEDNPPHKIAWATVDAASPDVKNTGAVRFDDQGDNITGVEVSLVYDPPAGKIGDAVAALLANPQAKVEEACAQFKTIIETR